MNFDEFVSQPQKVDTQILHQLQVAERLRSLCESATATFKDVKVQTSPENKREKWLTSYIDAKKTLTDLMEEHDRVTDEVRRWLYDNLPMDGASLLEFRYCDGLKNQEIANTVHMAEQSVKNKISRTIREARSIYNTQKGDN